MFENLTLFYQYINEKSALQLSKRFVRETKSSWTYLKTGSIVQEFSDSGGVLGEYSDDEPEFITDSILNQGDQSESILEQPQMDSGEIINDRKSLKNWKQFR